MKQPYDFSTEKSSATRGDAFALEREAAEVGNPGLVIVASALRRVETARAAGRPPFQQDLAILLNFVSSQRMTVQNAEVSLNGPPET